ncbi:hypothetical protein PHMEG_00030830 [Phytophthora megakarya]|uniref:Uncharacterized protein n=1 Tax=Phytophthora megakarya TaxID=4795 RepID=A0A225UZN2_9STRA|nr:hypothetical protein PHMEG_00030830 [Phytophthora megakarya]
MALGALQFRRSPRRAWCWVEHTSSPLQNPTGSAYRGSSRRPQRRFPWGHQSFLRAGTSRLDSAAERHVVGVPATDTSLRRGSRIYDGCGGLETPLLFESLSSEDLANLEGLLGRDSLDFLLQLRSYALTAQERTTEARSSLVQREVASILVHFSSERLAERVYNTMSFLRRLLVKVRDIFSVWMRARLRTTLSGSRTRTMLWNVSGQPCISTGTAMSKVLSVEALRQWRPGLVSFATWRRV